MKPNDFIKMCEDAMEKVIKQGVVSVKEKGGCAYRSDIGCCIVGHMMPDNETRKKADILGNSGVKSVIREGIWGKGVFTGQQIKTLSILQYIHDSFEDPLVEGPFKINVEQFERRCLTVLDKYKESL